VKLEFLGTLVVAVFATFCACQKKAQPATPAGASEPRKIEFITPANPTVTAQQAARWLACNPYLDSLSSLYKDSLSSSDPAKRVLYQDHFLKTQDRICVRLGLSGGYQEYVWILKNLGNPTNKRIVDSLKLFTFR
jgi:hypothetical protein